MTDYGYATKYTFCISTAIAGSGTTATPDGDRIYFTCAKVNGSDKMTGKLKRGPSNLGIYDKVGAEENTVTLTDCIVQLYGAVTDYTTAFNNMKDFLKKKQKRSTSSLYLFVHNNVDNKDIYLSTSSASASQNFMKGYPLTKDWSLEQIYKFDSIQFVETS